MFSGLPVHGSEVHASATSFLHLLFSHTLGTIPSIHSLHLAACSNRVLQAPQHANISLSLSHKSTPSSSHISRKAHPRRSRGLGMQPGTLDVDGRAVRDSLDGLEL